MVMIPVGNRTRHCFRIWSFAEVQVRLILSALLLHRLGEISTSTNQYYFIIILFGLWSIRPLYYELKQLYLSWRDAQHEIKKRSKKNG